MPAGSRRSEVSARRGSACTSVSRMVCGAMRALLDQPPELLTLKAKRPSFPARGRWRVRKRATEGWTLDSPGLWPLVLVIALFTLAACGPSQPPAASAPPPPAAAAPSDGDRAQAAAAAQGRIAALATPYNQADYEAGRRVFGQCRSCHTIEAGGPNRVGPNLHGVFGRKIGTNPGFEYSAAVQAANFTWDAAQLDHWLANPQTFLPGNRMAFAGVRNETQRRDLIAYLMVESEPK